MYRKNNKASTIRKELLLLSPTTVPKEQENRMRSADEHNDSETEVMFKSTPQQDSDVSNKAAIVQVENHPVHDDIMTDVRLPLLPTDNTQPTSYGKFDILWKDILLQRKSKSRELNIIVKCKDGNDRELFQLLKHILDQDLSIHEDKTGDKIGDQCELKIENKTKMNSRMKPASCETKTDDTTEGKTEKKRKIDSKREQAARNTILFLRDFHREEQRDVNIRYTSSEATWLILRCQSANSLRDVWRKCLGGNLKPFIEQCIGGPQCEVYLNEEEYVLCINEFDSQEKVKLKDSNKHEQYKVEYAACTCNIGTSCHCGHVSALLFQLAYYKLMKLPLVPNDVAKTSVPQTWHVPRGEKMNGDKVDNIVVQRWPKASRKTNGS